jgi:hypothetical protein
MVTIPYAHMQAELEKYQKLFLIVMQRPMDTLKNDTSLRFYDNKYVSISITNNQSANFYQSEDKFKIIFTFIT